MSAARARKPRSRRLLLGVLGALSAFGPLSMDLYLPGLPELGSTLGAPDAAAQFTLSACLIGLAVGQLIAGPVSDRVGRRAPLLIGIAVFAVASLLCAVAPTVGVLILLRFIQGLAGSAGIVISRAIVRDLYEPHEAARVFSRLVLVTGTAPVIAPVAGGALLLVVDWRGIFIVLTGIGLVLLAAAWFVVPDTLADENRHSGQLREQLGAMRLIARDRTFIAYALAGGLATTALFAYISMSSLVFQQQYGLTAQTFSLLFALNSAGMVVASQANAALLSRFGARRLLVVVLVVATLAAAAVLAAATLLLPLVSFLAFLFIALSTQGAQQPNSTALALAPFARNAGSAAALLGSAQYLIGAIIPPVVSLGGTSAVIMSSTMVVASGSALLVMLTVGRQGRSRSPAAGAEPLR